MPVVIAIVAIIVLAFLWAWHLDRRTKRDPARQVSPAELTRGSHDSRVGARAMRQAGGFTGQPDDHPH
ncbi:MAG: hypothetical protein ACRDTP_09675 [Mycobacteriales bacterium]